MRRASLRASPVIDFRNSAVPDRAIVPRFSTSSSRDMPMPLSATVRVFAPASSRTRMPRSVSSPSSSGAASASKRSLSAASAAFEMSSRRKMSRLLFSEWIISCSSWRTSAWKPCVSTVAVVLTRRAPRIPGVAPGAMARTMGAEAPFSSQPDARRDIRPKFARIVRW